MQIQRIASIEQADSLGDSWNGLSGDNPFCSWTWLRPWWEHYGQRAELAVLAVHDERSLVGIAPWFIARSPAFGRVVRFLGSGHVCSDYLTILASRGQAEQVARAVAEWLHTPAARDADARDFRWDLLELSGVEHEDKTVGALAQHLGELGHLATSRPECNGWRIALPGSWDEYLAGLSKSRRKPIRRVQRCYLDTGQAVLRTANSEDELETGMRILVDLHQRRRRTLGQPGCFASVRFSRFLHAAAPALLRRAALRLRWIELDGEPVAAEFHVAASKLAFAYQSGISPEHMKSEPGRIIHVATLQQAIAEGMHAFDFMRGDEPYKADLGAVPRAMVSWRIVPRQAAARLRHGAWIAGQTVKRWIKGGARLVAVR